jgi:hypothetical protein
LANKVDIRANVAKNRLYMSFAGFFQDDEIKQIVDKIMAETLKLKPGFDAVVDISNAKPATPQGVEEIKKVQAFSLQHGVKRSIRVVGEAVLAQSQLDRGAKNTGLDAGLASSIEEADRILDGK